MGVSDLYFFMTMKELKYQSSEISNWLQKIGSPFFSPEETMAWLAEQLILEYKNNHPRAKYPYSLYKIAKELCKVELADNKLSDRLLNRGRYGSLRIKKDGFVVFLSPFQNKARKNFTLAHEIGHTFFYDKSNSPPLPLLSLPTLKKEEDLIERLCNIFATNLLLPKHEVVKFTEEINSRRFNITSLEKIAGIFNVSIKTLVIRIKELNLISNPRLFIISIEQKKDENTFYGEVIKNQSLPIKLNLRNKLLSLNNLTPFQIENLMIDGLFKDKDIVLDIPIKIYKAGQANYGVGIFYLEERHISYN